MGEKKWGKRKWRGIRFALVPLLRTASRRKKTLGRMSNGSAREEKEAQNLKGGKERGGYTLT